MAPEKIADQIKASLEAVLNREVPELSAGTLLFDELALDSTSVLELLMNLEDTIGLEIDPAELDEEVFQTFGSLTAYVTAQFQRAQA
jgi:acyl carrier protein